MQWLFGLEWQLAVKQNYKEHIRTVAENGFFHMFTCCDSLRGYETPKFLLHDLHHHILSPEESVVLAERGNYPPPHVYLPLLGCFKARYQEEKRRIIDICWETNSGRQPDIWAQRLIGGLEDCGITRGWAYQKQYYGTHMRMSEIADSFFSILLDIQKYQPNLIAPDIDVIKDYEISKSER